MISRENDSSRAWSDRSVGVQRVRKAYEQVADELRKLVMTGQLPNGERLPPETVLAREFGVSRATIREALRVLAAQNMIRTSKGAGGGSYITLPTVDHISESMTSNLQLLTEAQSVTLNEFLEARRVIEIAATRMAAERADPTTLERLKASVPREGGELSVDERYRYDREFHSVIVEGSRNTLLYIAAQPIFYILQANLERSTSWREVQVTISEQHESVARAIIAHDPDAAEQEMHLHMDFLERIYEEIWRPRSSGQGQEE